MRNLFRRRGAAALLGALTLAWHASAAADGDAAGAADQETQASELAMKLQNPVANLISVPIQNNWDFGIGPADAFRYLANVQPVIPFSITADWNLITRTIVPIVFQESPVSGGNDKAGLGDILQSFFLSPKEPVAGGWIVGAGPALLYPSATDDALGGREIRTRADGRAAEATQRLDLRSAREPRLVGRRQGQPPGPELDLSAALRLVHDEDPQHHRPEHGVHATTGRTSSGRCR